MWIQQDFRTFYKVEHMRLGCFEILAKSVNVILVCIDDAALHLLPIFPIALISCPLNAVTANG